MVFFKRVILTLCVLAVYLGISHSKSQLIQLNEDNWQEMLTGEWMVEFYAPWCPACKALQPLWEDFSTWSKDLDFSVGQVDVTTSPGLSGRFMVTALPTIFHIINGEFRQYKGTRDRDAFISFIDDAKWESVEPIPSWKSPSSIQMSIVSHFFKLSQVLRTIHNKLMDDYGLPNWGSYVIFALVTILLGAVLGLLMVCFIDFVYPPKVKVYYPPEDKLGSAGLEEDDLDKEELVDENTEQENVDNAETAARKRKARKAD